MDYPRNGFLKGLYVLSVDVCTTSIRGHVYDKEANIKGSSSEKISLLYPNPGWVELDPEELWLQFVAVAKAAVQAAGIQMKQITALGISTQTATFTTWSRKTGKPFDNFISWQDRRASELVTSWNNSFTMKVQEAVEEGNCCFGTIDTWLLYRLTKGSSTDVSFKILVQLGGADGGMCNNNFVMQLTANLFNRKINRLRHVDMPSLGAAFTAGLGIGFWSSREELKCLGCTEKVFYPQNVWENYKPVIDHWEKALTRSMHWYSKP